MNKRYTTVIGVLLIILALLIGCGDQTVEQNGDEESTENQNSFDFSFPEESGNNQGLSNFSTLDIYGKTVTQSIFAEHDLTMVNIWGTFCSPCLDEMPDLAEIQEEYNEQGFNIVGIVVDVQDTKGLIVGELVEKAQDIVSNTGASYTHLIPSANLYSGLLKDVQYIPHTVFVDSQGSIVGEEYVGSRSKKEWIEIIESML